MDNFPDKNSIVDTLKYRGYKSDFITRKDIYERKYGERYTGSASQNERFNRDLNRYFDSNLKYA